MDKVMLSVKQWLARPSQLVTYEQLGEHSAARLLAGVGMLR